MQFLLSVCNKRKEVDKSLKLRDVRHDSLARVLPVLKANIKTKGGITMTVETLFGAEVVPAHKPRNIKLKTIKAVYQTITVSDTITDYLKPNSRYTSASQVFDTFSFLRLETKEHFIALHLDGKNRIVCCDMVSTGSLNQSIVHPRELFKTALLSSAAAVILLHNHPTGDPTPSTEDLTITRRLQEAGDMIGIRVLDHIIIGDSYYSFAERGQL